MDRGALIRQRVDEYFASGKYNCTMTVLAVLSEIFEIPVGPQTMGAGQCLPSAGGTGGLCGLVSGMLMFLGVWGHEEGFHRQALQPGCLRLMEAIEGRFGSTLCTELRPADGCAPLAVAFLEFIVPIVEEVSIRRISC
ncbi:MAG: C-GCAxxG-C-C family (seleno)protein [Anaerolineae bacterium]